MPVMEAFPIQVELGSLSAGVLLLSDGWLLVL